MPGAVADVNRPPVIAATTDIDNHASGVYNQWLLAARPNTSRGDEGDSAEPIR